MTLFSEAMNTVRSVSSLGKQRPSDSGAVGAGDQNPVEKRQEMWDKRRQKAGA